MRPKERMCWAVTGGVLMGIIIGLCISPLTAQDGNFGNITCMNLRVVDAGGKQMVLEVWRISRCRQERWKGWSAPRYH